MLHLSTRVVEKAGRIAAWGLIGFLAASGCESASDDEEGMADDECGPSERYSTYEPGLTQQGSNALSVRLMTSNPGPPEKGDNIWNLTIQDGSGAGVEGANVIVAPLMPEHGHGVSVEAVVEPGAAAGEYLAQPVHFSMAGVWEITVTVADAAMQPLDEVVFKLCIEA